MLKGGNGDDISTASAARTRTRCPARSKRSWSSISVRLAVFVQSPPGTSDLLVVARSGHPVRWSHFGSGAAGRADPHLVSPRRPRTARLHTTIRLCGKRAAVPPRSRRRCQPEIIEYTAVKRRIIRLGRSHPQYPLRSRDGDRRLARLRTRRLSLITMATAAAKTPGSDMGGIAQIRSRLRGKVLRIDVDGPPDPVSLMPPRHESVRRRRRGAGSNRARSS